MVLPAAGICSVHRQSEQRYLHRGGQQVLHRGRQQVVVLPVAGEEAQAGL